jgi:hypothetical protein
MLLAGPGDAANVTQTTMRYRDRRWQRDIVGRGWAGLRSVCDERRPGWAGS